MKFTLSKKQWEYLGKKANWIKEAQNVILDDYELTPDQHNKILSWAIRHTNTDEEADRLLAKIKHELAQYSSISVDDPQEVEEILFDMKINGVEHLLDKLGISHI